MVRNTCGKQCKDHSNRTEEDEAYEILVHKLQEVGPEARQWFYC
jgi:hypothetical protein